MCLRGVWACGVALVSWSPRSNTSNINWSCVSLGIRDRSCTAWVLQRWSWIPDAVQVVRDQSLSGLSLSMLLELVWSPSSCVGRYRCKGNLFMWREANLFPVVWGWAEKCRSSDPQKAVFTGFSTESKAQRVFSEGCSLCSVEIFLNSGWPQLEAGRYAKWSYSLTDLAVLEKEQERCMLLRLYWSLSHCS